VFIPDPGKLILSESARELHERRPQAAMNVGDFPFDELADQDFGVVGDNRRRTEDLPTLGMPPPASANPTTSNCLREIRNWTVGGLKDHTVVFDECERFLRSHSSTTGNRTTAPLLLSAEL
jgi:hypothetical protein